MPANEYMQPFFDSLSQGVQVAQHLTQAALQMRELQQQRAAEQARQQLAQQEFQAQQQQSLGQALAGGAQPVRNGNVSIPAPTPQVNAPTLQSTGGMSLDFKNTTPADVPADPSRTYTVAGQTLQAPSLQDQLDRTIANKKALEDADRIAISDKLADAAGLPRGSKVSPEHLAGLGAMAHWLNPPQQDNSPTVLHTQIIGDDKGNQTIVNQMSDGTVKETPLNAKGKTDKFAHPEVEAANANTRALTANAAQDVKNKALADYQRLTKEESEIDQQRLAIGTALKSGQHYVDKNGTLKKFDAAATDEEKAAQLEDMKNRFAAVTKRREEVVAEKNDAMQRYGATPQVSTQQAVQAIRDGAQPGASAPKQAAASPAAAPAQAQRFTVGQTATNPKTKKQVRWDGKAWQPI
jgi:hypothetical protein